MFWENSLLFSNYQFQSLKLYIFIKYFSKYFFYYSYFNFLYNIRLKNKFLITSNIQSFIKVKYRPIKFTDKLRKRVGFLKNLKVYIYSLNGKFYILFIYLNTFNIKYRVKKRVRKKIAHFIKSSLYL